MATGKVIKRAGKEYKATNLPPQTPLDYVYTISGTTAEVTISFSDVIPDQLPNLKEYAVVINENRIPQNPNDGIVYKIPKGGI